VCNTCSGRSAAAKSWSHVTHHPSHHLHLLLIKRRVIILFFWAFDFNFKGDCGSFVNCIANCACKNTHKTILVSKKKPAPLTRSKSCIDPIYFPSLRKELACHISLRFQQVTHLHQSRQQRAADRSAGDGRERSAAALTVSAPSAAVFGGFSQPA
jgi:hypothetical protein